MEIEQFMKTIQGLSDNTRRAYEQSLYQYESYSKGAELTAAGMQKFLNQYNPSTLHRHKAAFKAYWEWKFTDRVWPFNRRSFLAPRQQVLRYIAPAVTMELVDKAKNKDDRMAVLTLFILGCRISEFRQISVDNITDSGVLVTTKGGNTKLKLLTKDFMVTLRKYAKGKRGKLFPRSYNYYYSVLKELGKQVGHPEVAPHMLRHSRAVDLRRKGMTEAELQQFLGHASPMTTRIYEQVTGGEIADILERVDGKHKSQSLDIDDIKKLFEADPDLREKLKLLLFPESKERKIAKPKRTSA